MLQQPAVKATFLDARTHLKFYLSYRDGKADYDVGLEPWESFEVLHFDSASLTVIFKKKRMGLYRIDPL